VATPQLVNETLQALAVPAKLVEGSGQPCLERGSIPFENASMFDFL